MFNNEFKARIEQAYRNVGNQPEPITNVAGTNSPRRAWHCIDPETGEPIITQQKAYELLLIEAEKLIRERGGTPDTENETWKQGLWQCANELIAPPTTRTFGITLVGCLGTGKTTTAKAIQNATNVFVQNQKAKLFPYGYGFRLVHARELAKLHTDGQYPSLVNQELLIVDDVGTEAPRFQYYGNEIEPFAELIEARYAQRLFTVITTNLTADELRATYGERVFDRFREMMTLITSFSEKSYRER